MYYCDESGYEIKIFEFAFREMWSFGIDLTLSYIIFKKQHTY